MLLSADVTTTVQKRELTSRHTGWKLDFASDRHFSARTVQAALDWKQREQMPLLCLVCSEGGAWDEMDRDRSGNKRRRA